MRKERREIAKKQYKEYKKSVAKGERMNFTEFWAEINENTKGAK